MECENCGFPIKREWIFNGKENKKYFFCKNKCLIKWFWKKEKSEKE